MLDRMPPRVKAVPIPATPADDGKLLGVDSNGNFVWADAPASSWSGVPWTQDTNVGKYQGFDTGGDAWVSGGTGASLAKYSVDSGITWANDSIPGLVGSSECYGLIGAEGVVILVTEYKIFLRDPNTNSYSAVHTSIAPDRHTNLLYAGGVWMVNVIDESSPANVGKVLVSTDSGQTWTPTSLPGSVAFREISVIEDTSSGTRLWFGIGSPGNAASGYLYRSVNDGVTWTVTTGIPTGYSTNSVINLEYALARSTNSGVIVICSPTSTGVSYKSTDNGATWTVVTYLTDARSVVYASGYFVSVTAAGVVSLNDSGSYIISSNLWSYNPSSRACLKYSSGLWVCFSTNSGIWVSVDGRAWTQSVNSAVDVSNIRFVNSVWFVGGYVPYKYRPSMQNTLERLAGSTYNSLNAGYYCDAIRR